ncbi:MAG: helix-turn-helix domain-containing protein, partial [Marmoricola sp.]
MESLRHKSADDPYLDAAREAILAVGWSRTTLTDIARRASVSRMTLYRRWPDMGTMLADLMTREWARTVATEVDLSTGGSSAEEAAAGASGDTVGRIARAVTATVGALRANDLLRRIIDLDPELLLPYLLDRRGR